MSAFQRVALTWRLSDLFGWGVYGWNLTQELARAGGPAPLLLVPPDLDGLDPLRRAHVEPLVREQEALASMMAVNPGLVMDLPDALVLHHLGADLARSRESRNVRGKRDVGVVFLENANLSPEAVARGRDFALIAAGSTWNADILRARGLDNVDVAIQGIDPSLFHPAPDAKRLFRDRFTVFSGGKLEHRKGQDIVLAAFKEFRGRHDDALLVAQWGNKWPKTSVSIARGGLVDAPPPIKDGVQDMAAWAEANGVPRHAFLDLGFVPNPHMPPILRHMDAAVFPNRCEGGTNLVAMECMACGVPTVLSANTGHLDLIGDDRCFVLEDQRSLPIDNAATEGWRESSVEELVEALERIHADREEAVRRAAIGARFMEGLSWRAQTARLLEICEGA